ncbi:hypothetical protein, partial [Nonomuraea dietziae]|uniref:hypothetical protein n=1 Tax=Nonomuraea dietziae TaxID=65515 RepID=UPI0031D82D1E
MQNVQSRSLLPRPPAAWATTSCSAALGEGGQGCRLLGDRVQPRAQLMWRSRDVVHARFSGDPAARVA